MTIVLAHPNQSTLLTRRAGPAAARRPSPPYWLAWQRDPHLEVAELRSFYNRERTRTENIKRTVASRRKVRARSPSPQSPEPIPAIEEPQSPTITEAPSPIIAPATPPPPTPAPLPIQPEKQLDLLGMYSSLLESRLQSVERVSKLLSDWREHKPLTTAPFPPSRFP
ncbi:hypothetical protein RSOLAG1IB_05531 [Rhizoctonia solani AG-1 IB]|uniref:Uncharacterized protein n=1 Tax=Thanatephorus cucumeris (strain AG1-IB / isolate 7/3/14) TaxID=1108050 RepID=M5BV44_THACB|nr:hypothetical protein BN14_01592 [Rhizoctonia solani AG-1 IB]CEL63769.1 hypothetical protein RSOLAG1IB_05531 [Rhizoctonia solani AG-1 IB]